MSNPSLSAMFDLLEKQLGASLNKSRAVFSHRGLKGGATESAIRDFLSCHLPRYYTVGTGEVIDYSGFRSRQLDVMIANEDQSFQYGVDESGLYLIEGVSAGGEVKSFLNTGQLKKAIEGGSTFKLLRNRLVSTYISTAQEEDRRRFFSCPPFFIFAYESNIAPLTLTRLLSQAPHVSPGQDRIKLPPVDAVFILGRGVAINYGEGNGGLQYSENGEPVKGWKWHESSQTLAFMLMWLGLAMPKLLRIDPITPHYLLASGFIQRANTEDTPLYDEDRP